jgi:hypothetical protein
MLQLPPLLPMLLPLLPPEASAAAVAAATADDSAHCSRSCGYLLLPLLMPATDKAVCCCPAAACLRLPTNAAAPTHVPHQMSLRQILLPLTLQELIPLPHCQYCRQSSGGEKFSNMFVMILDNIWILNVF